MQRYIKIFLLYITPLLITSCEYKDYGKKIYDTAKVEFGEEISDYKFHGYPPSGRGLVRLS